MKKIIYFALLMLVIGCSDDSNSKLNSSTEEQIEKNFNAPINDIAVADITIRCNGNCGTNLPVCDTEFNEEDAWCSCEDCSMTIIQDKGKEINYLSGSFYNTMMKVQNVVGVDEYNSRKVSSISIGFDQERLRELIWLEGALENGELFTSIIIFCISVKANNR